MTTPKHTPGPLGLHIGWDCVRVLRSTQSGHDEDYIADVFGDNAEADGALFAAAPDLLDAAIQVLADGRAVRAELGKNGYLVDLTDLERAVAKAKGQRE